jgi:hypothetical protein
MGPRCGVPDIINGTNTMKNGTKPLNNSLYSFFFPDRFVKWNITIFMYKDLNGRSWLCYWSSTVDDCPSWLLTLDQSLASGGSDTRQGDEAAHSGSAKIYNNRRRWLLWRNLKARHKDINLNGRSWLCYWSSMVDSRRNWLLILDPLLALKMRPKV